MPGQTQPSILNRKYQLAIILHLPPPLPLSQLSTTGYSGTCMCQVVEDMERDGGANFFWRYQRIVSVVGGLLMNNLPFALLVVLVFLCHFQVILFISSMPGSRFERKCRFPRMCKRYHLLTGAAGTAYGRYQFRTLVYPGQRAGALLRGLWCCGRCNDWHAELRGCSRVVFLNAPACSSPTTGVSSTV